MKSFSRLVLILCIAPLLLGSPLARAQISSFRHIIVVIQENRTPDNLFQGLCNAPYGRSGSCSTTPTGSQYDIQTTNWRDKTSSTGVTQPGPVPLANAYDLNHAFGGFEVACDMNSSHLCRMDGSGLIQCFGTCPTSPAFKYVDNSTGTVNPYLSLATQYGWANYMFQTNQGPSFPAHQFLFGGTSAPSQSDDAGGIFASENVSTGTQLQTAGCIAQSTTIGWHCTSQAAPEFSIFTN
jgi:phospholipase C